MRQGDEAGLAGVDPDVLVGGAVAAVVVDVEAAGAVVAVGDADAEGVVRIAPGEDGGVGAGPAFGEGARLGEGDVFGAVEGAEVVGFEVCGRDGGDFGEVWGGEGFGGTGRGGGGDGRGG